MKFLKLTLLCSIFLIISCHKKEVHPYSFYYWKTKLALNETEKKTLNQATLPYLYTRFFDVDKIDNKFQPVGIITKDKSFETQKKIIPTVFITNRTFLYIKKEEITFLAKSVYDLIQKKASEYHLTTHSEIQIDCDWTVGTRDDYFKF